jgi:light-regulated signal transduction histidine kinase (bacteriophytochrome)
VLINDLLAFSRFSRLPLNKIAVDMNVLVQDVLAGLDLKPQGREIKLHIGALPSCQADPALLKQAWMNLLSNALKYTGRRQQSVIEINCQAGLDESTVYFVRDNGAGFDMRYAGKLFGVFQRLHSVEEYEGTGAGLAIVQRIINRHGGRIWAEAAVDQGATFYFTLGSSNHS